MAHRPDNNQPDNAPQFEPGNERQARSQVDGWLGLSEGGSVLPGPTMATGNSQAAHLSPQKFEQGWAAIQGRLQSQDSASQFNEEPVRGPSIFSRPWATAGALAVMGVVVGVVLWAPFNQGPSQIAGRLVQAKGSIKIERDGKTIVLELPAEPSLAPQSELSPESDPAAKPGLATGARELMAGSRIVSGPGSRYLIHFGTKSALEVTGPAHIVFMADKFTAPSPNKDGRGVIDLKQGELAAVIGERWASLNVRASNYTMAVTGTTFYHKVVNKSEGYFCICHGQAELNYTGIHGQHNHHSVDAGHHLAMRFTRQDGVTIMQPAKMAYHHDPELEALAKSIGLTIPWKWPQ